MIIHTDTVHTMMCINFYFIFYFLFPLGKFLGRGLLRQRIQRSLRSLNRTRFSKSSTMSLRHFMLTLSACVLQVLTFKLLRNLEVKIITRFWAPAVSLVLYMCVCYVVSLERPGRQCNTLFFQGGKQNFWGSVTCPISHSRQVMLSHES